MFDDFLASWLVENFNDHLEDELGNKFGKKDVMCSRLFSDIKDEWSWDDNEAATRLIRFKGWSFASAQYFYEENLTGKAKEYQRKLGEKWVKQNAYEPPFDQGVRVRWATYGAQLEGVIGATDERFLNAGYYNVQTDSCAELEKEMAKYMHSYQIGSFGEKIEWENLEVIDD